MLSEKIRELRTGKGMNQQQAATFIGVDYYRYSSFERGIQPRMADLKKIIDAYGISRNKLYSFLFE